jgi:hypothetical protein
VIAAGVMSFRLSGQFDRPARAIAPATAMAASSSPDIRKESLAPAPDPRPDDPDEALPPLTPEPGGTAPGRVAPVGRGPDTKEPRHRDPARVAPPQDEPEPAPPSDHEAAPVTESSTDAPSRATALPDVTFDGLRLVTGFDEDNDPEEADAHLVLHADRFTVVNDDAERVAHEIVFGSAAVRSGQAVLSGTVRLLNGSEIYLILPSSSGRVTLRVDHDDATRLAREIERRLHKAVTWSLGELTRDR